MPKLRRCLLLLAVVLLFFFLTLPTILGHLLPFYLRTQLIPALASRTGIRECRGEIRHLGWYRCDFARLTVGSRPGAPALEIDSLRLDYSPADLLHRRLERIVVGGLRLYAVLRDGRLQLRNFSPPPAAAPADRAPATTGGRRRPRPRWKKLLVRDAVLVVTAGKHRFSIPFTGEMCSSPTPTAVLHLHPREQEIIIRASGGQQDKIITFTARSPGLELAAFADWLHRALPGLELDGRLEGHAEGSFSLVTGRLETMQVEAWVRRPHLAIRPAGCRFSSGPRREPLHFTLELETPKTCRFSLAHLPLPFLPGGEISSLAGTLQRLTGKLLAAAGDLDLAFSRQFPEKSPHRQKSPVFRLREKFAVRQEKSGAWKLDLEPASPAKPLRLQLDPRSWCSFEPPRFTVTVAGQGRERVVSGRLQMQKLAAGTRDGLRATIAALDLAVRAAGNPKDKVAATFTLALANARTTGGDATFSWPTATLKGRFDGGGKTPVKAAGHLEFSRLAGSFPRAAAACSGGRAVIPWQWPPPAKGRPGKFHLASLRWQKRQLGPVSGTVRQQGTGFAFAGSHHNRLLPHLQCTFSGRGNRDAAGKLQVVFQLQALRPASVPPVNLENFFPLPAGTTGNGALELTARLSLTAGRFGGSGHLHLRDGSLDNLKKNLQLRGLELDLELTTLVPLRSAPRQRLAFGSFTAGRLRAGPGEIFFQVENPRSLFIENSAVFWCNGHLYVPAVRLAAARGDYRFNLYGDRLQLPALLAQFGVRASGGGRVSGRLPIRLQSGKISFGDGFLYSTPGEGGEIHLTGTDSLATAIPGGLPARQLDLAREALKDYHYDWAKLNLETSGDDLVLRLQLSGKPAAPLPFVFNRQTGSFDRAPAGSPGAVFQGIDLDLNFRIPVNKILSYQGMLDVIR